MRRRSAPQKRRPSRTRTVRGRQRKGAAPVDLLDALPDAAVVLDRASGETLRLNERARRYREIFGERFVTACDELSQQSGDIHLSAPGLSDVWLRRHDVPIEFLGRRATLILMHDATALHDAKRALHESERRYAMVAYGANDGLWEWDLVRNKMYLSPRWKAMLGCSEEEVGESPNEWFVRIHPEDLERVQRRIDEHLKDGSSNFEVEYRMLHKDGAYRWILTRGLTVRGQDGTSLLMAGSQSDITERRDAQEQLVRKAFYDPLTSLPNRALFMDRLHCAVERTRRSTHYQFAVLFIDLDRFKVVNDSLGHLVGDQLLVQIARRLEKGLRTVDTFARLGGDEFAIILDDIRSANDARFIANRIKKEFQRPFRIGEMTIHSSASIGIALSAEGYNSDEDLLREADMAMYRAKAKGKGRYQIFDAALLSSEINLLHLENDLRLAMEREEFRLHYQPIVELATRDVVAFEALLRWLHPRRGLVSPADFIPVAEETGLIVGIGSWVLDEACRQMREWAAEFVERPGLSVSVNLSSKQLANLGLGDHVTRALEATSLEASRLKLEITESVLVEDSQTTARLLGQFKQMGIEVLIDDFGTGYSSLSYLHSFPVDTLKIDRSFIAKMTADDRKNREIVRSTISLAHNLGLRVVAEGVETEEQAQLLTDFGCDFAQGWYFSKPVEAERVPELLASPAGPPLAAVAAVSEAVS